MSSLVSSTKCNHIVLYCIVKAPLLYLDFNLHLRTCLYMHETEQECIETAA